VVLTLIGTAKAFAYMMSDLRIPEQITALLMSVTQNKYLLLLIINLLLLFLGCVMDMAPLIMIMTPILLPMVMDPRNGMNPIHFGVGAHLQPCCRAMHTSVGSALFRGLCHRQDDTGKNIKAALPMFSVDVHWC
jgi:TRAP-type C4-dicarboxylate transport system permease large subunit